MRSGVDLLPLLVLGILWSIFDRRFMRFTRYVKNTLMFSAIFAPIERGLCLMLDSHSPVKNYLQVYQLGYSSKVQ
jgi:hypothetical protein